jgi:hypothetical protein
MGISQIFPLLNIFFNGADLFQDRLGLAVVVPETFLGSKLLLLCYLGLLGIKVKDTSTVPGSGILESGSFPGTLPLSVRLYFRAVSLCLINLIILICVWETVLEITSEKGPI